MRRKISALARFGTALLLLSAIAAPARPQPAPRSVSAPRLGVSWYPEQWPEERWDADLSLMKRAGIRFVRVGEFAWSTMEPAEGRYDFEWLDRAIQAAGRHGIQVVIGTPTAGPPLWLTTKYPDVLRTLPDGTRARHGGRHHGRYSSAEFISLSRKIVAKLADRYGRNDNVIGWQIDNEIGADDRGADTLRQFQNWLKGRYATIDNLNKQWTTVYWSQTYQDFSQVPLPDRMDSNPGLMMAWRRFISDGYRHYVKSQVDVLREKINPRQKITTNYWIDSRPKTVADFSPDADALDIYDTSQDLDFASWDLYTSPGHIEPARFGMTHDIIRGLLRRNFWVMETQPGFVNWSVNNTHLDPGELRAVAWHAVSHGADAVAYWQWRSPLNGQEQYHGTIVGSDGTPLPIYDEVARIGAEFATAAPALDGTTVMSQVAILNDYPSRWAIGWQRFARDFSPSDAMLDYYKPVRALVRSVDVVGTAAPLDKYRLVVAPALNVLSADAAKKLSDFVHAGGHLVLGARSGLKDEHNSLWSYRQPGPLVALLGAKVGQWYVLEKPIAVSGPWGSGLATTWAERIDVTSPDTFVALRYGSESGWLAGQPAAVSRRVGRGSITYVGANLSPDLMTAVVSRLAKEAVVQPVFPSLPPDIDVAVREGQGRRVLILTNYNASKRDVTLPTPMQDVLRKQTVRSVSLPQYGVAVLDAGASPRM